ncbi:MAG: hypothetical protein CUN56_00160 [Phototrophicales bacterium]|nr:MAG: hypothetical protein CUN56_00160 [Phototrophicales bacterium]
MARKKKTVNFEPGQTVENHDGTYIVTTIGLPNTCSVTGEPVTDGYWLAKSPDHARAGHGISKAAFLKMTPEQPDPDEE